jgi:dihydrofolate reductase
MRRIVAAAFVSLDGVMQAPGGPDEDTDSGFKFGGWTFHYFDEAVGGVMDELFTRKFDLLLGRKTYDIFAAHWPRVGADDPIGNLFNSVTKYVATRSNPTLEWVNSQSLGSDIVAKLRELKASDGPELLIQGSSDLIQTLIENELIDEYSLLIFPVLLGNGKRLFGNGTMPKALKLTEQRAFPNGVMLAKYVPAGEVRTGSFALDQ